MSIWGHAPCPRTSSSNGVSFAKRVRHEPKWLTSSTQPPTPDSRQRNREATVIHLVMSPVTVRRGAKASTAIAARETGNG
jgi:hypothetical protein